MLEFLTAIAIMCQQPGVGTGTINPSVAEELHHKAFKAQTECIKSLYKNCIEEYRRSHTKGMECALDKL